MINNVNTSTVKQNNASLKSQQQLIDRRIFDTFKLHAGDKTAYMPTGRLIKSKGPISGLAVGIKDTAVDAKNFAKTLSTGKSNDHSLGRMNDLGLKVGGALIAGYLASKKMAPTSKAMEFVGFGAFLASMALWPRITIDAPIRAKHGFNIRQKYIDNEGRKKEFFQDNQYLPWDLWSKEEINKIADRMGIDKNMKDREEFTRKKMQKIALQGNTAWMLSCGLGVPLSTSMICKALEKPLELSNIDLAIRRSQKQITNLSKEPGKFGKFIDKLFGTSNPDFTKISGSFDSKVEQIFDEIDPLRFVKSAKDKDSMNLFKGLPNYSEGVMADIKALLAPKYVDNPDALAKLLSEKVFNGLESESFSGEIRKITVPTAKIKAAIERANTKDGVNFAEKLLKELGSIEELSSGGYTLIPGGSKKGFVDSVTQLIHEKGLAETSEADALRKLTEDGKLIRRLQKKTGNLSEAINAIFGERAESAATLKYRGISSSILEQSGAKKNMKLLKTIKEQGAEDKAYEVVKDVFLKSAKKSSVGDEAYIDAFMKLADSSRGKGIFGKRISSILEHFGEKSASSKNIERALDGLGGDITSIDGLSSLKELYSKENLSGFKKFISKFIRESRSNVDSTSYRALATLDFERRVSEGALEKFVKNRYGNTEMLGEFTELARDMIYNGTKNDFSSAERFVKAGKTDLFDGVLEFLFDKPVADSTRKAIDKAAKATEESGAVSKEAKALISGFEGYREELFKALRVKGPDGALKRSIPSKGNFYLTGKPITEILQEASQKAYNNKRWLKIFGIATIAVALTTIIATFAFGKMKEKKLYEQESKGAGNVA